MDKQELLNKLNRAKSIIYDASRCIDQIKNLEAQHQQGYSYSSATMSKPFKFLIGIDIAFMLISLVTISNDVRVTFVLLGIGVAVLILLLRLRKKFIDGKNRDVAVHNVGLEEEKRKIESEWKGIQAKYNEEVGSWYPPDYAYREAVDFFIFSIQNSRADSLKEAVNLFEEELHRKKIELQNAQNLANQEYMNRQLQEMEQNQRVGEALSKGQLALLGLSLFR